MLIVQLVDQGWSEMDTADKVTLLLVGGSFLQSIFAHLSVEAVEDGKKKKANSR
jgi:hypothetical protein